MADHAAAGMTMLAQAWSRCVRALRPGLGQLGTHEPRRLPLDWRRPELPDAGDWPRLSIVVPSYNQGRFLARTLDSILGQGYPNLELLAVDGGSSDDSPQILARYARQLAWWVSEPDQGQAHAINKGFARATGELLAWINSDDLVAPGALHRVARHFREHPAVDVVYGDRIVIDEQDREVGRWLLPFHSPGVLRWVDYVPQETLYWRRTAWNRAGARLDEALHFALDWDLVLRLASTGARFSHLPLPLGLFRVHASQKTTAQIAERGLGEMRQLRHRTLGYSPSRARVILAVLPYLLAARLRELRGTRTAQARTPA